MGQRWRRNWQQRGRGVTGGEYGHGREERLLAVVVVVAAMAMVVALAAVAAAAVVTAASVVEAV
ncbi:hypothetical protein K0M31_019468 [Melipona bicolor]|uniref:Uncharacterized protein n=1 Tax=Melipona bicolor TaxID=60889 RepID=A0AA40G2B3_9HYME|nr:hypothetical protein K0M31_019468 [Melipona bicolor]